MLIHPVILSGGSGTRLWPLSREHHPKQLLSLLGGRTMLQETACRLDGLEDIAAPIVVCNEEYRFLVAEQMRQLQKPCAAIILEAVGRNTAPALTFAALALTKNGQDALMLVMPADHVIQDHAALYACIEQGKKLAQSGHLVTFGITPSRPETGYGYIKKGDGNAVAAFVEKPDLETAQRYLASGDYFWNSGIFMMRATVWLEELSRFQADMLRACKVAYDGRSQDGDFVRMPKDSLLQCKASSIDYGRHSGRFVRRTHKAT